MPAPFDPQSFGREFFRYRGDLVARPLDVEQKVLRVSTFEGAGLAMKSDSFARELSRVLPGGRIAVSGRRSAPSKFEAIAPQEFGDLELRIEVDQDGTQHATLWSKSAQQRRWEQLRFSPRDVKRLWPVLGLRLRKSRTLDQAVLTFLYQLTANGPLKKDDAMRQSRAVSGWTRNSFKRAWSDLHESRKLARGKHGPRTHPV